MASEVKPEDRPTILAFFSVDDLSDGFTANRWTTTEETRVLAGIARDAAVEPMVRMAAVERLRSHAYNAAVLGGFIQSVEGRLESTHGNIRAIAGSTAVRLLPGRDSYSETMDLLQRGLAEQPSLLPILEDTPYDAIDAPRSDEVSGVCEPESSPESPPPPGSTPEALGDA